MRDDIGHKSAASGDTCDHRAPRRPQQFEELAQAGLAPPGCGPDQPASVVVDHESQEPKEHVLPVSATRFGGDLHVDSAVPKSLKNGPIRMPVGDQVVHLLGGERLAHRVHTQFGVIG